MTLFNRFAGGVIAGIGLLAGATVAPGAGRDDKAAERPLLISHEDLKARLDDPKVRILDARPRADYDQGHIPGAAWVDLKAFQALTKAETHADPSAWARQLEPLGIGQGIEAVYIYDGNRQHDSSRVWWSLSYAGVPRVGLVDGGFASWKKANRPVSTDAAKVEPAAVRVHFREHFLIGREQVKESRQGASPLLVDARAAEEYRGEKKAANSQAKAGHLPGALNLDAYSLVDQDGHFLPSAEIRSNLGRLGIQDGRPVVVYSAGGNRSSLVVFALEREGVKTGHYVGGYSEWSRTPGLEIVSGANAGK